MKRVQNIIILPFAAFILVFSSFTKKENKISSSPVSVSDTTHLTAYIVQNTPIGTRTVLVLNKGTVHNVKTGNLGFIHGRDSLRFRITEVYTTRSKATVESLVPDSIRKVVIIVQK